jgi:hypothetical protein
MDQRAELAKGLRNDAYKFSFIEADSEPPPSAYREIFDVIDDRPGKHIEESNAAFNTALRKTADGEEIQTSPLTAARTFHGDKDRYTDRFEVSRDILERDAGKQEVKNMLQTWVAMS